LTREGFAETSDERWSAEICNGIRIQRDFIGNPREKIKATQNNLVEMKSHEGTLTENGQSEFEKHRDELGLGQGCQRTSTCGQVESRS
jgi:hypothetical protein